MNDVRRKQAMNHKRFLFFVSLSFFGDLLAIFGLSWAFLFCFFGAISALIFSFFSVRCLSMSIARSGVRLVNCFLNSPESFDFVQSSTGCGFFVSLWMNSTVSLAASIVLMFSLIFWRSACSSLKRNSCFSCCSMMMSLVFSL